MGKLLGSSKQKSDEGNNSNSNDELSTEPSRAQNLIPPKTTLARKHDNNKNNSNNPQHALSASLITSVNVAADTARIVLDQSTKNNKKNEPININTASHSNQDEEMAVMEWEVKESSKTVTFSSPPPSDKSSNSLNKLDTSVRSELTTETTSYYDGCSSSQGGGGGISSDPNLCVPGSSPPPLAFQNLPMSRYMPLSSHTNDSTDVNEDSRVGSSKPFEVTNHYDAAAAISAALASSHLAQASGVVAGELSSVHQKKNGFARRESLSEDNVVNIMVLSPSYNSHKSKYQAGSNSNNTASTPLARTLPSQEEAEQEMRERRSSYESFNDDSFSDYLSKAHDNRMRKKPESGYHDNSGKQNIHDEKITEENNSVLPKVNEHYRRSSDQIEGGGSISISSNGSSNGRSSAFENESNTSSYGNSSNFSPVTMSFGSSSGDDKQSMEQKNNNMDGILGTLNSGTPAAPADVGQGDSSSYSATDEEDNSEHHQKQKMTKCRSPGQLDHASSYPSKHNLAPSRTQLLKVNNKPSSLEQIQESMLPINQQYVALFEGFDQNLAQSVDPISNDVMTTSGKMFELSQQFLSSFVAVFGKLVGNNIKDTDLKKQSDDIASMADTGLTHYDWWSVNLNEVLGYNFGIVNEGTTSEEQTKQQEISAGVPIEVVRSMWRSCLFDSPEVANVEEIMDKIQDTLVNNLHYLAEAEINTVPCLCLTLPLYREYAWYALQRCSSSTLNVWHSKFADFLHELLLTKSNKGDSRTLLRYAAYALPRHAVFGLQCANQDDPLTLVIRNENQERYGACVMKKLLTNNNFIQARIELLGNEGAEHREHAQHMDDEVDKTLPSAIKTSKERRRNYLPSTIVHIKDIDSFSAMSGCVEPENLVEKNHDYIKAVATWRHKLLQQSKEKKKTASTDNEANITSVSLHSLNSSGVPKCNISVAKTLLLQEDAWSSCESSEENKKSRKSSTRSRKSRNTSLDPKKLEIAINANVGDIKTELSIGRSILTLAKFVQNSTRKNQSSAAPTFQEQVAFCLRDAIEILSSISKTLQLILSKSHAKLVEDDLDDSITTLGPAACLEKFALARAEARPLLILTGIFLADAWFSLGRMPSGQATGRIHKDKLLMMACFDRSLLILSTKEATQNELMEPLTKHQALLQSNVNHAMGVCLYNSGIFDRSECCLKDATSLRRRLLDGFRNQMPQSPSILSSFSNHVANYFFSPQQTVSEAMLTDVIEHSKAWAISLLPKKITQKSETDDLELSLSLTLEYSALTNHANQSFQIALALFQEALILRSLHVGKNSLDIASLHFNTGVVHDDLEQYHQAVNRYQESLRIRQNYLKTAPTGELTEIEDSILLNLKCLAHVYKLIDDLDKAISFYVMALMLLKSKVKRHTEQADKWQIMGMRFDIAVPPPTFIFDEMRNYNSSACQSNNDSWKKHFQAINKKIICHSFSESGNQTELDNRTRHKLEKELSKIHSILVDLIQNKKHAEPSLPRKSSNISLRYPTNLLSQDSDLTIENMSKFQQGNFFDTALMSSSFCLGRSRMASSRTKWAQDPAYSSDSDSDAGSSSRISAVRSRISAHVVSEDDPEEGQLYYALGLANSVIDDHERAVRCYITALRYLRRTLKMVDSLEVARVLFDTATSYYYLCEWEQAESLWLDCLRILGKQEMDGSYAMRRGIVLYCLVLTRTAQKTYDSDMYSMLNEAQTLLSTTNDKTILAYMEFLTGYFLLESASKIRLGPQISSSKMQARPTINPIGNIPWEEVNKTALSLFQQVKNECWFDQDHDDTTNINDLKNLPMSAHVSLLEGQVLELMGCFNPAMNSYKEALNLYFIACGHDNVYSASVMHRMGMLCTHSQENGHKAMGFFNGAISTRKLILGGNDPRLAESLYASAMVLSQHCRYESAMERYHDALRIQISTLGQSSSEVAITLTSIGLCHYTNRSYDLSLTCFLGALKVRHHRVAHLLRAVEDEKKKIISDDDSVNPTIHDKLDVVHAEEVALGNVYFNLGNIYLHLGDHTQSMDYYIKARDLKWQHVGGGSTEKIMKRYLCSDIDEEALLGLAHCLHNIGLLFDIKKDHDRSLPHYEEALTIKNALAGFDSGLSDYTLTNEKDNFILRCLESKDTELPVISKATLSTAMTHIRMASVYTKKKLYNQSLRHYCQALKIQRKVLGRDHFTTSVLLSNIGNVLNQTSAEDHSSTVEILYKESLRISSQRFGKSHERVASALFSLGELYDTKHQFDQAIGYYRSALSVYRDRYSSQLRHRLCGSYRSVSPISNDGDSSENSEEVLSTGDRIVSCNTSFSTEEIQKQYLLVSEALRKATREDVVRNGGGTWLDSNEYWLRFEVLLFQFVEMLSTYVVDPTNIAVKNMIMQSQKRLESVASHAIITAADALDYQFQLMLQE